MYPAPDPRTTRWRHCREPSPSFHQSILTLKIPDGFIIIGRRTGTEPSFLDCLRPYTYFPIFTSPSRSKQKPTMPAPLLQEPWRSYDESPSSCSDSAGRERLDALVANPTKTTTGRTVPSKRRVRTPKACPECRRRKIRCNGVKTGFCSSRTGCEVTWHVSEPSGK